MTDMEAKLQEAQDKKAAADANKTSGKKTDTSKKAAPTKKAAKQPLAEKEPMPAQPHVEPADSEKASEPETKPAAPEAASTQETPSMTTEQAPVSAKKASGKAYYLAHTAIVATTLIAIATILMYVVPASIMSSQAAAIDNLQQMEQLALEKERERHAAFIGEQLPLLAITAARRTPKWDNAIGRWLFKPQVVGVVSQDKQFVTVTQKGDELIVHLPEHDSAQAAILRDGNGTAVSETYVLGGQARIAIPSAVYTDVWVEVVPSHYNPEHFQAVPTKAEEETVVVSSR